MRSDDDVVQVWYKYTKKHPLLTPPRFLALPVPIHVQQGRDEGRQLATHARGQAPADPWSNRGGGGLVSSIHVRLTLHTRARLLIHLRGGPRALPRPWQGQLLRNQHGQVVQQGGGIGRWAGRLVHLWAGGQAFSHLWLPVPWPPVPWYIGACRGQ